MPLLLPRARLSQVAQHSALVPVWVQRRSLLRRRRMQRVEVGEAAGIWRARWLRR